MTGTIYGIGVGPGDPELMTLKALRAIKNSEIVILPTEPKENCYAYQIVKAVMPEIDEKNILCRHFPMTRDAAVLEEAHQRIYAELKGLLLEGKNIAFLTIGDPTVYSTYGYIHDRAVTDGLQAVIISGVTSFCAVAARLGISLGDSRDEIHIIPGALSLEGTLELSGTKVYMKSGKTLVQLIDRLKEKRAQGEKYEVYAVSNCGYDNEVVMTGIDEIDTNSGYLTIVIVKDGR